MGDVGVGHDQLGERVVLELGQEVETGGAFQVVEAVAVLQLLHLRLEDEIEGRAEQAAERHLLFGEAADPQVDSVQAAEVSPPAIGAGGEQEVEAIAWNGHGRLVAERQRIAIHAAITVDESIGGLALGQRSWSRS